MSLCLIRRGFDTNGRIKKVKRIFPIWNLIYDVLFFGGKSKCEILYDT